MITELIISQDNLTNGCITLSVHNPLIFIIDAEFTGLQPEYVKCDISIDGSLVGSYRCVPFEYVTETRISYLLKSDSIIRAYMDSFEDVVTSFNILESVPTFSKSVKLTFSDPEIEVAAPVEVEFIAVHATRDIGNNPCLVDIETNEPDTYYSFGSHPVYVYFFNNDGANVIVELSYETMLDSDDEVLLDSDNEELICLFE